jgi:medium-chain acyl-[acyl-carrier-protein] hydrolase
MSNSLSLDPWLICHRPNPQARLRLFCFPYAGGGAYLFRPWKDSFPEDVEIFSVQLPGRENRLSEPPFTRLSLLIERLFQVLKPYLEIPFIFFGHSMGTLISFELARQLRRENAQQPVHLFVSGHNAPHIPDSSEAIHQLPDREFIEKLRSYKGTPEAVLQNDELMKLMIPILRADFELCETYTCLPEEPLDCSISAFGGISDEWTSEENLSAWRDHTSCSFSVRMFPGDHFFLNGSRSLLLQSINKDLCRFLR